MLYILPGTKIYRELVKAGKFNEKIWVHTGAVYYYIKEHSIKTLNRWRKKINNSGIKIPFSGKYFWDYNLPDKPENVGRIRRRFRKTIKKLNRFINMQRNRY